MSSNEYMRIYMIERYRRRHAAAIAQLGGRCVVCGATTDLEFDHVDRSTKTFTITTKLASGAEAMLQAELTKCQLLCREHHLAKTRSEGSLCGNIETYVCCGRSFHGSNSYAGHRRWHQPA